MISTSQYIRRLRKYGAQYKDDQTDIGRGIYQGVQYAIADALEFEAETQVHLRDNPRAVGVLINNLRKTLWSNHERWTTHKPKKKKDPLLVAFEADNIVEKT